MEWHQVVEFLKGAAIAHLATASPDGEPHVSVVSPAVEGDGLWLSTTSTSRTARNLRANPRVALVGAVKARLWESGLFPFDLAAFWGTPDNPALNFVRVEPSAAMVMSVGPEGLMQQRWRRSS